MSFKAWENRPIVLYYITIIIEGQTTKVREHFKNTLPKVKCNMAKNHEFRWITVWSSCFTFHVISSPIIRIVSQNGFTCACQLEETKVCPQFMHGCLEFFINFNTTGVVTRLLVRENIQHQSSSQWPKSVRDVQFNYHHRISLVLCRRKGRIGICRFQEIKAMRDTIFRQIQLFEVCVGINVCFSGRFLRHILNIREDVLWDSLRILGGTLWITRGLHWENSIKDPWARNYSRSRIVSQIRRDCRPSGPCCNSACTTRRGCYNPRDSVRVLCRREVMTGMLQIKVNQPYHFWMRVVIGRVVLYCTIPRCHDCDDINVSCKITCQTTQWLFIPLFPCFLCEAKSLDLVSPVRIWFNKRRRVVK